MVLLTAASGSGRRTAAVRLLRTDEPGSGPIHELPVHQEDPDEHLLDRDDVVENDRLLLDFSSVSEDLFETLQGTLAGFWGTVRERHAVLVVVLPERNARDLDPEFADLLVRLGRPDGASVFERHLAAYGIEPARDELRRQELVQMVDHGSMQDIAHVASLVRQARDRSDRATGFAALLGKALAAHGEWADEAAAQVAGQSGRDRALMLASALFDGSFTDTVFEADRLLVRALNLPEDQNHEFEEPDLRSRLGGIGAEIGPDNRVRFRELNYAEAVRRHFWKHFPGLRDRRPGRRRGRSGRESMRRPAVVRAALMGAGDDTAATAADQHVRELLPAGAAGDLGSGPVRHRRGGRRHDARRPRRLLISFWVAAVVLAVTLLVLGLLAGRYQDRNLGQRMVRRVQWWRSRRGR